MKIAIVLFLLVGCGHMFFSPWKDVNPDAPTNYSEISFNSLDGTHLTAWLFKAKTPQAKGTIVFFHGNSRNVSYNTANVQWMSVPTQTRPLDSYCNPASHNLRFVAL